MSVTGSSPIDFNHARLSTGEFNQLARLVYSTCGIHLPPTKKIMLEGRLAKRLRALGVRSFKEYIGYLATDEGIEHELVHMIDVVTTNKTDFFREPHHFDYLTSTILPAYHKQHHGRKPFRIWSAACSTGEEPYTIAMVLEDFNLQKNLPYTITASDISTQVLQKASAAIYPLGHVASLPITVKKRYFLKSKDQEKPTVRVTGDIRSKVRFMRLNLVESSYSSLDEQDVIFCRNVLIYFDRKTQQEVVRKLVQQLKPGGHLFIGHSESLHQFDLPIIQIRPTIFTKK